MSPPSLNLLLLRMNRDITTRKEETKTLVRQMGCPSYKASWEVFLMMVAAVFKRISSQSALTSEQVFLSRQFILSVLVRYPQFVLPCLSLILIAFSSLADILRLAPNTSPPEAQSLIKSHRLSCKAAVCLC